MSPDIVKCPPERHNYPYLRLAGVFPLLAFLNYKKIFEANEN